ncbi:hypothetical protein ABS71_06060 [bacterium SCN 62-11]|nr:MAG: hypothetical protein ABS71_06060 [bacterium SCN 62-11]
MRAFLFQSAWWLVVLAAPAFPDSEGVLVHYGGGQLDFLGKQGRFHVHPSRNVYLAVSKEGLGTSWRLKLEGRSPQAVKILSHNRDVSWAVTQLRGYLERIQKRDFEGARRFLAHRSTAELDPGHFAAFQPQWLPPDPSQWILESWNQDRILIRLQGYSGTAESGPRKFESRVEMRRETGIWLLSNWSALRSNPGSHHR